jgi:uncharacterized protein YciI
VSDNPLVTPTRPRRTLFLVTCHDAAGAAEPRETYMREHLAHIERHIDRYVVAGPAVDADGRIDGSILIIDAADEAAARSLLEADPYWLHGAWSRIDIRRFRGVCGSVVGGITWPAVT